MRTKVTYEQQSDDISKLYAEVARKAAEVRRASGLSHYEFASKLGVPVCYTEILENGVLVCKDGEHYLHCNACLFTTEELLRISGQLSDESVSRLFIPANDAETVFYYPVTLNSAAVLDEVRGFAGSRNLTSYLMQQDIGRFTMKYRTFYAQFRRQSGKEAADRMTRHVLSLLSGYEPQLRQRAPY